MPSAFTTELPERQLDSRPNFFETNALPRSGIAFVNSRVWSSRLAAGRTGGSRRKAGGEQPQTGVGPLQRPCPDEIRKPRARRSPRKDLAARQAEKFVYGRGSRRRYIARLARPATSRGALGFTSDFMRPRVYVWRVSRRPAERGGGARQLPLAAAATLICMSGGAIKETKTPLSNAPGLGRGIYAPNFSAAICITRPQH